MSSILLVAPKAVAVCPADAGQKWLVVGPYLLACRLLAGGQIARMEELLLAGDGGQIVVYRFSPPLLRFEAVAELQRIKSLCGQFAEDVVLSPV